MSAVSRTVTEAAVVACTNARKSYVDASLPFDFGSVRLQSASGPMESVWLRVLDTDGNAVSLDAATGRHVATSARLTPDDARRLALLLTAYARSHDETETE